MATNKELEELLKGLDKVEIGFDVPVLDRIKLECLSFIAEEMIPSPHGTSVKIGDVEYKLGIKNTYHHLSVGRALYRLIRSNPAAGDIVDQKHLSVRLLGEEVSRLTKHYMDEAYEKAKASGFGFESLRYHRISDAEVDQVILIEALMFIKLDKPLDKIVVYSQTEEVKKLRAELQKLEEEKREAAKKLTASQTSKKAGGTRLANVMMPPKPDRSDKKYDGLFGDDEYAADLKAYEQKIGMLEPEEEACCDVDEGVVEEGEDNEE